MSELSDIIDALKPVSTATITTVLLKHGLRRVWMRGTRPIRSGQPRIVGRAFTLRFIPAREDLATPASWASPRSTRAAIEDMPPGCVAVADAMGVTDAGIFGDILCARIKQRGVAGLVTDGAVRDMAGVLKTGLNVWCAGAAAPPSVAALTFVNWQEPIGCGGVRCLSRRCCGGGRRRRGADPSRARRGRGSRRCRSRSAWRHGSWMKSRRARSCPGLYPPNEDNLKRYKDWASRR